MKDYRITVSLKKANELYLKDVSTKLGLTKCGTINLILLFAKKNNILSRIKYDSNKG
jgi:hypothetical protein